MAYRFKIEKELDDKLKDMDKSLYERTLKKIEELIETPYIGKPMRSKLKGSRRVHIGSFVLFYYIDESNRIVHFYEFVHHDEAYL